MNITCPLKHRGLETVTHTKLLYAFFWVISWCQGITQKKAYNIQNTVKVWNQHTKCIYLSVAGYIMKVSIAQILYIQWLVKN